MSDPHDPLIGKTLLGKLAVVRRLGEGGMGAVYEVEHLLTRHRRALKVLHPEAAASADALRRFQREATVAGRLKIPHVVETLDAGRFEDGSPFVLMELLSGLTLRQLLQRERVLSPLRAARLMIQVCEGLSVAHEHGIIHRDLKPENLFVQVDEHSGREQIKLLDFGISKFARDHATGYGTKDQSLLGTPEYMSPEQIRESKDVDGRTDIYALGVVLYEAVCGQRPCTAPTFFELCNLVINGEHQRAGEVESSVPPELDAIVERALHHERAQRFATANDLLIQLQTFVAGYHSSQVVSASSSPSQPLSPAGHVVRNESDAVAYAPTIQDAGVKTIPPLQSESEPRAIAPLPSKSPSVQVSRAGDRSLAKARVIRMGVAAVLIAIVIGWGMLATTREPEGAVEQIPPEDPGPPGGGRGPSSAAAIRPQTIQDVTDDPVTVAGAGATTVQADRERNGSRRDKQRSGDDSKPASQTDIVLPGPPRNAALPTTEQTPVEQTTEPRVIESAPPASAPRPAPSERPASKAGLYTDNPYD